MYYPGKFKQKIVGILLIIVGAFPLINAIKPIAEYFSKYPWLSYFNGGGAVYQFVIIALGIVLVFEGRRFRRGYY
ncbi:hypothetical protein J4429_02225 [Candidatus Pacearchaeota archaeon]|nr:hypothetical protein [Candidatus Pacearchaeota archaeon]